MKDLFEFAAAPAALFALVAMIGVAGGIEAGSISFAAGSAIALILVAVEAFALDGIMRKEARDNEEDQDIDE